MTASVPGLNSLVPAIGGSELGGTGHVFLTRTDRGDHDASQYDRDEDSDTPPGGTVILAWGCRKGSPVEGI